MTSYGCVESADPCTDFCNAYAMFLVRMSLPQMLSFISIESSINYSSSKTIDYVDSFLQQKTEKDNGDILIEIVSKVAKRLSEERTTSITLIDHNEGERKRTTVAVPIP